MDANTLLFVGIYLAAFVISISLHEAAHAYTAHIFGDRTPQSQGRLTLNPLRHLSLWGTLLPVVALVLRSPFIFGWGKPVPVSYAQLRARPYSIALIAAAGPLTNILLGILFAVASAYMLARGEDPNSGVIAFLQFMILMNAILAVFNLIPLAPLDGATVFTSLLPQRLRDAYDDYIAPYGMYIFLALLLSGNIGWLSVMVDRLQEAMRDTARILV